MATPKVAEWDPGLRIRVGADLASRLQPRAGELDAVGRSLAPDGPGPGVRFGEFDGPTLVATKSVAYQHRFPDGPAELFALLRGGHPGALALALEIASRLDPEACVEPAAALLALRPWNDLGSALARVLGRCSSERSFRLLVDHPDAPYVRSGIRTNRWPKGVAEAWALVRAVDWSANVEPRLRDATLPVFGYLLLHDPVPAFDEVVRLVDAPSGHTFASHALAASPEGREVLIARMLATPPGQPFRLSDRLALDALLGRDPGTVADALGGEAFLKTAEGRPRLVALLDSLRRDTWNAPKEAGGSRGWLAKDPRFARLCLGLKGDPDKALSALARDLVATLPKDARPSGIRWMAGQLAWTSKTSGSRKTRLRKGLASNCTWTCSWPPST